MPWVCTPSPTMSRLNLMERDFRRKVLEHEMIVAEGNRTRAAKSLGLQRTYLLRLLKELDCTVPPVRRDWPNGRKRAETGTLISKA
jgi:DNA-binding NtrC family response regulator